MSSRLAALAVCAALVTPRPAAAQVTGPPRKHLTAARAVGAIAVDGALDEAAWAAAAPIRDLTQKQPSYGAPPRHPTEIRVLYDGDALYVGARMWDAPGATRAVVTRRDQTRDAERFIVSVDPYRTGRLAYSFAVTVAGVRADWIHTDDSEGERDLSWDPVWMAKTRRLPDGWTAELRVPWSQLRYPTPDADGDATTAAPAAWGINFNRYIPDGNEDTFWITVPRERTAWSSYMGELRGLDALPRRLGLELRPYAAGAVTIAEHDGAADLDGNLGLDAKLGLGAGLTLDLALNPDFGQVEADPAIVNLSAFEVSLPERRPFFVAGNESFAAAPSPYFYSRRIGADGARLLGAAKLSGRLAARTSVATLVAVTDEPGAGDAAGGLAGWSAARLERERGASRLGATIAAVGRSAALDPAAPRPTTSLVGGVDGLHRWDDGAWELAGVVGGSGVWGAAPAIERVQRSSTHYFQRPDADHLALDPRRTSLAGWHARGELARRAGTVQGAATLEVESPGFDPNGPGLLQRADEVAASVGSGLYDTTPSAGWQARQVEVEGGAAWSFGGERRSTYAQLEVSGTTRGFVDLNVGVGALLPAMADALTRGGPRVATGGGGYLFAGAGARGTSTVSWGLSGEAEHTRHGTTATAGSASVSLRPDDRLRVELAPHLRVARDRLQYVATVDGGGAATYGQRYVFATLDQLELSLVGRVELTLGPDLALDLYVQPFVSRGAYRDLAELARAGGGALRRYADVTRAGTRVLIDDGGVRFALPEPDFTARALRSTAVLRWEPRPGSTFYAVWQQERGDLEGRARAVGPGLLDAVRAPGGHTVALKIAWWFAR